jgi:hypothetical protein
VCSSDLIYSVSRSCRIVYQHPKSPFNLTRLGGKALPRLQFLPQSPVYFDRHTLNIKDGQVSMYTLDGRMRFQINLAPGDEQRFRDEKLREIVLSSPKGLGFQLAFYFATSLVDDEAAPASADDAGELPEYVLVTSDEPAPALPPPPVLRTDNLHLAP